MRTVFAYIDPSSGMITIQLVVATIAGGFMFLIGTISRAVRRLMGRPEPRSSVQAEQAETGAVDSRR